MRPRRRRGRVAMSCWCNNWFWLARLRYAKSLRCCNLGCRSAAPAGLIVICAATGVQLRCKLGALCCLSHMGLRVCKKDEDPSREVVPRRIEASQKGGSRESSASHQISAHCLSHDARAARPSGADTASSHGPYTHTRSQKNGCRRQPAAGQPYQPR